MYNKSYLLASILANSAVKYPDKTALIVEDQAYSYAKIYQDASQFAQHLSQLECNKQDIILILTGNAYLTVVSFFGSVFYGCVPCIVDHDNYTANSDFYLDQLEPAYIVDHPDQYADISIAYSHNEINVNLTESDLALIIYTSGSTGLPKGVMLSHRNVLAAIESITDYLKLRHDDIVLSVLPLHFDYGLYQILLLFSVGGTVILEKNAYYSHHLLKKIAVRHVTILPCVPQLVRLFVEASKSALYQLSSVRMVTNTGERLSKQHILHLQNLCENAVIFSMYGLTECKRCSYIPPDKLHSKWNSIGLPMSNLSMWIEDGHSLKVPVGVEGDLVVSGPTVMMGYWKNTTETNKKIRVDQSGRRILLTGDRAVYDSDGFIYFKGRLDGVVKFRGMKFCIHDYVCRVMCYCGVNRAHIFQLEYQGHDEIVVCVELYDSFSEKDTLKLNLKEIFPVAQQPSFFYFTSQFPSLKNGKLNRMQLEQDARAQLI